VLRVPGPSYRLRGHMVMYLLSVPATMVAAQTVLALELAGFEGALWPGSWSEWITDPARPVATDAP